MVINIVMASNCCRASIPLDQYGGQHWPRHFSSIIYMVVSIGRGTSFQSYICVLRVHDDAVCRYSQEVLRTPLCQRRLLLLHATMIWKPM